MHNLETFERLIAQSLAKLDRTARIKDVDHAFCEAGLKSRSLGEHLGHDLPSAARALAQKACLVDDVTLTDPRRNNLTGLSGLPLFFASQEDTVVATIKAFPHGSPQFAQTVWAAQNLARVTTNCPRPLAFGFATDEGRDYGLVASTYLPGEIINDRMLAMAAMPIGRERMSARDALSAIIYKLGVFLGTLHTAGPNFYGTESSRVKDAHELAICRSLAGFKSAPDFGIDVDLLSASTKRLMNAMAHHEYRYAYIHGDAHPGNYLYDSDHDRIALLDVDGGAKTISGLREPLGSPFTDYVKITASMKVRELLGITSTETAILRKAFDDGYLDAFGKIPAAELEHYYTVMEVYDYAAWYFEHVNHLAPDVKTIMHQILLTAVTWLRDIFQEDIYGVSAPRKNE